MRGRGSRLGPRVSVRGSLLLERRLVHGDHYLLRSAGAQAVGVVQGDVAHLQQPGPLAQLGRLVRDAVDLGFVAAADSTRAKGPV